MPFLEQIIEKAISPDTDNEKTELEELRTHARTKVPNSADVLINLLYLYCFNFNTDT